MCSDHHCVGYPESADDKGVYMKCMYCECRWFVPYK